MGSLISIQQQLIPDLLGEMKCRVTLLQHISHLQPIGRRTLAQTLGMTERILRAHVDFLKAQGLVVIESNGMSLSTAGRNLLDQLQPMMSDIFGLRDLEYALEKKLKLKQVIIVPGNSDETPMVKQELGRAGAKYVAQSVKENDIIAVTGGSSVASVAKMLSPNPTFRKVMFVPARGGLGGNVEFQANTLASQMAIHVGAQYRLLHMPDSLTDEAYQSLMKDPETAQTLAEVRSARMVIHGIGQAITMAERRGVDAQTLAILQEKSAKAEAFGYYFDIKGNIVHQTPTTGLRLEDIQKAECVVAIAGGKRKAKAIQAIANYGFQHVLVTDEGAAKTIMELPLS